VTESSNLPENPANQQVSKLDNKFEKRRFLSPRAKYRGKFTPEHLAFNANLQEFANQVALLCNLETAGKITPNDTYQEIKKLWKELQTSKRNLLNQEEP
jgi:hypothetical protein